MHCKDTKNRTNAKGVVRKIVSKSVIFVLNFVFCKV